MDDILNDLNSIVASVTKPVSDLNEQIAILQPLVDVANEVGKSWSGSWLGYQSHIYYTDFKIPPHSAYFDQNLGRAIGEWRQCTRSEVQAHIVNRAGVKSMDAAMKSAEIADSALHKAKLELISILTIVAKEDLTFCEKLIKDIEGFRPKTPFEIVSTWCPKQSMTTDRRAASEGTVAPPHLSFKSEFHYLEGVAAACTHLISYAEQVHSHIRRLNRAKRSDSTMGSKIFIGHGGAPDWKDLKDFLTERLSLQYDEFNRVSTAGIPTVERIKVMLDDAAFAFIVLTAEDEVGDKVRARMNVIHESGLFQGRLGFNKAIILLEHGCEQFSNIEGLTQIRFEKNRLSDKFEEIRRVLEREHVIKTSGPK